MNRDLYYENRNFAFTLAEVLITLGIIGVVAAVTMPTLIANISERTNSERHANIAQKITQAVEHMRATDKLVHYDSTEAFVNELKNHLKISKICSAENLSECWPTETVKASDGSEYNVANAKTRKNILYSGRTFDNNVGLVLADGASIILTYDSSSAGFGVGDRVSATTKALPVGNNKTKDFPYTTSSTGAIDFIVDVNGKKGPNKEGEHYDVRSFKNARFITENKVCASDSSYGCIKNIASWSPVNCSDTSSEDYATYCIGHPSGKEFDYWAGAKKACAEAGMKLPSRAELKTTYQNRAQYSPFPQLGVWYFTETEVGANATSQAWSLVFEKTNGTEGNVIKDTTNGHVLCISSN